MSEKKLGIIGGGQLGSMLSQAAKKLNIKVADVENMENRFMHEDKSLNAKVSFQILVVSASSW